MRIRHRTTSLFRRGRFLIPRLRSIRPKDDPPTPQLGVVGGITATILAILFYFGDKYTHIVVKDPKGGLLQTLLFAVVFVFMVTFVSSIYSLISLFVISVSEKAGVFWKRTCNLMITLSLFVLIFSPFLLIVLTVQHSLDQLGIPRTSELLFPVYILLMVLLFISASAFARSIPAFRPSLIPYPRGFVKTFGKPFVVSFFTLCVFLTVAYIQSCYVFELRPTSTVLRKGDDFIQLNVRLSGKIFNHDSLIADLLQVKHNQSVKTAEIGFSEVEPGQYVAWRDTGDLEQGMYRVVVRFRHYRQKAFFFKLFAMLQNNHREKTIILRIV